MYIPPEVVAFAAGFLTATVMLVAAGALLSARKRKGYDR